MKNIDALKPYLHFALLCFGLWLIFDYIPNTVRDGVHEEITECVRERVDEYRWATPLGIAPPPEWAPKTKKDAELAAWRLCVQGRLEGKD